MKPASPIRLAICGPGRSGKDTAALWLASHTTLRYMQSTSEAAAAVVFDRLRDQYGSRRYSTLADCFADRHNHRQEWADIIWRYNGETKVRLYEEMVERGDDVLNGIRCADELRACVERGIVGLAVWIDRPGCEEASCKVTARDCDVVVMNHGTVVELCEKMRRLAGAMGVLRETRETMETIK